MTETNGTAVPTVETAAKRGRKPGQLVWTFERVVARANRGTIIDRAKLEWLNTTYASTDLESGEIIPLTTLQVMILADHSKVNTYWSESAEYKAASARTAEMLAENEAFKAAEALKASTAVVSNETLFAALTPAQLAYIMAMQAGDAAK
jgi:hypothetical protein